MRLLGILLLLPAYGSTAVAAPATDWTTHSAGGTVDAGFSHTCRGSKVLLDAASNSILVRAYGPAILSIVKYAPTGEVVWQRDDRPPSQLHHLRDSCLAAIDSAGDIYVASSADDGNTRDRGIVTAKYSGVDGELLWTAESASTSLFALNGLVVDPTGDVWLLARGRTAQHMSVSLIAKYKGATGEPAWPARENGEILDTVPYQLLAADAHGDVVIASNFNAAKLSGTDGERIWSARVPELGVFEYPATYLVPNGLAFDANGNVVLVKAEEASRRYVDANSYYSLSDFVAVKFSGATGAKFWSGLLNGMARYDGPISGHDSPAGVATDSAGNVFVHGTSESGEPGNELPDFATVKLAAATGELVWGGPSDGAVRYDGAASGRDAPTAIAVDAVGDVFVTGSSTNFAGDEDFLTRKYSGNTGEPLWTALPESAARHDGPVGGFDAATGIAIGTSGDVFVAGREEGPDNNDQVLLRHDGRTGATIWAARSEPTVTRTERIQYQRALTTAIDDAGNTYVAGTSFNGSCDEWLVMKVAADGTRLWSRHFSRPRTAYRAGCGIPFGLVLTASGDLFVTGHLRGHIATAKFSGVDGSALWTDQPDGVASKEGDFSDGYTGLFVATDSQGDVIVAAGGQTLSRFAYVVKYDGETGAQMWIGQHGPSPYFIGHSVALQSGLMVDADDNVVVMIDEPGRPLVSTIKYDGATGYTMWGDTALGAAQFACSKPVLALDPAQDVVVSCSVHEFSISSPTDFATIKYSNATGQPVWTDSPDGSVRYASPGGRNDRVEAMAVDLRGNIYVSGRSQGADGEWDWATVKYAGDGSPVWAQGVVRQDSPDHDIAGLMLMADRAFVVAGTAFGAPHTRTDGQVPSGAWSVHDARTGALLHTGMSPDGSTLRAALFAPAGGLLLSGTADDLHESATVYVQRITGLDIPIFSSGFERGE